MNQTLIRLVADNIAFLELSGDDVVDPDAAVREVEAIVHRLRGLSDDEREQFISFVEDVLATEARASGDEQRAQFLMTVRNELA
jgi:hypothetical protein